MSYDAATVALEELYLESLYWLIAAIWCYKCGAHA